MPTLYMLIGVPGSGKTTWVSNFVKTQATMPVVLSTDDYIEKVADRSGKTYNDVFKDEIKNATAQLNKDLAAAVANEQDIIWDQTNTTVKGRKGKLAQIPSTYKKVAVFFPVPKDLEQRLATRPGKTIPYNILNGMISMLEQPTIEEGFDNELILR